MHWIRSLQKKEQDAETRTRRIQQALDELKIMYLCRLGRECPDLDCEIIFEPSEWKSVYMTVRNEDPPSTPPTLNEMIRMIATLGGYVNRCSTQPGPQTLWLGLQRVHGLSTAWDAFGPES